MSHVCGFICYLCVKLKLTINTRSLSNQALKSAHPSLLCCPLKAFEEYSLGLVSRYSTVRSGTLTWHEWGLWSGVLPLKFLVVIREIHKNLWRCPGLVWFIKGTHSECLFLVRKVCRAIVCCAIYESWFQQLEMYHKQLEIQSLLS